MDSGVTIGLSKKILLYGISSVVRLDIQVHTSLVLEMRNNFIYDGFYEGLFIILFDYFQRRRLYSLE